MGNFEPRQGTPFITITGELAGDAVAGDALEADSAGEWARATGANVGTIGIAAAAGGNGDVISIYIAGIFRTLNGTGSAALVVGEWAVLKDHIEVDAGSTGDRALLVVGPAKSNADNAIVDVLLQPMSQVILA